MSSDADKAHAFLEGLRRAGQSGSATFGSITAGRMSVQGPNLNQIARQHNEQRYPDTVRRIDALAARVCGDFSNGGLP